MPNQQTVEYPSFKLVIVGDGGTGWSLFSGFSFIRDLFGTGEFFLFPFSFCFAKVNILVYELKMIQMKTLLPC